MHTNGGFEALRTRLLTKVWLGILWGLVRFSRICQCCIAEAVSATADRTYHHSVCALLISQQKPWNQLNRLYSRPTSRDASKTAMSRLLHFPPLSKMFTCEYPRTTCRVVVNDETKRKRCWTVSILFLLSANDEQTILEDNRCISTKKHFCCIWEDCSPFYVQVILNIPLKYVLLCHCRAAPFGIVHWNMAGHYATFLYGVF